MRATSEQGAPTIVSTGCAAVALLFAACLPTPPAPPLAPDDGEVEVLVSDEEDLLERAL